MMSHGSIISILKKHRQTLSDEYGVKSLYLFGSQAVGKQEKNSDIDMLVEFDNHNTGLLKFINLKFYLERILKSKVDLVTQDSLVSWMKTAIDKEKIRVA